MKVGKKNPKIRKRIQDYQTYVFIVCWSYPILMALIISAQQSKNTVSIIKHSRYIHLTLVLPRGEGVTVTPYGFRPGGNKTAKCFTKHFKVVVSSSFAVILTYKSRGYHLYQGQDEPSKVEGVCVWGGGHCDFACIFNGK